MITGKPTEHLTGVTLEGEFEDFYELVDSIYRMTRLEEDYDDPYWSVKNRLLGISYEIRHAYQGDRTVKMVDNWVNEDLMRRHDMVLPKKSVHYAVEVLFPEALFVAFAVPELCEDSVKYYGARPRKRQEKDEGPKRPVPDYSDYIRDQANLGMLSSAILSAFAEVIGDASFERVMGLSKSYFTYFGHFLAQYVDRCNVEYIKAAQEKKPDKLKNIGRRFFNCPDAYVRMRRDIEMGASEYGCSVHEMYDPRVKYPEEIVW